MPPAQYTAPVARTFSARLPASLASIETSKSTVARHNSFGCCGSKAASTIGVIFGRFNQLSNFQPFQDVFLIA